MYAMAREAYWWVWFVDGVLFGLFEGFVCVFGFFLCIPEETAGEKILE